MKKGGGWAEEEEEEERRRKKEECVVDRFVEFLLLKRWLRSCQAWKRQRLGLPLQAAAFPRSGSRNRTHADLNNDE